MVLLDVNIELIRDLRGNGLAERILLAGILGTSHAATQAALEDGYLEPLVERLKETYIDLAVIPPDIPRNKKVIFLFIYFSHRYNKITF